MEKQRRFRNGERGKLKWGHLLWNGDPNYSPPAKYTYLGNDGCLGIYDTAPERVGMVVTIEYSYKDMYGGSGEKNDLQYSVTLEKGGKLAWIDDSQLEKIKDE